MHQNRTILAKLGTSPKFGKIPNRVRQVARPFGNQKRQKKVSADRADRHGFLNHVFSPLINSYPEEISDQISVEKEFFNSAENVCSFYGLPPLNLPSSAYPGNIAQVVEDLKQKLEGD